MKKKKIYKIVTVVVMLSVLISVACVNASAFYYEDIDDITDEVLDNSGASYIRYYDDYALIDMGTFYNGLTHIPTGIPAWTDYQTVSGLENFLTSLDSINTQFGASYSTDTLRYIEFIVVDETDNSVVHSGDVVECGRNECEYFASGLRVQEKVPGLDYRFGFLDKYYDTYSVILRESGISDMIFKWGYRLIAVCYFDEASPYGVSNEKVAELEAEIATLQSQISALNEEIEALKLDIKTKGNTIQKLEKQLSLCESDKEALSSQVAELEAEITAYDELVNEKNIEINDLNAALESKKNQIKVLENSVDKLSDDLVEYQKILTEKQSQIIALEGADSIDNLFTGITSGLLDMFNAVSELRFGENGVSVGELLTITVVGVVAFFVIKLVRGT